MLNPNLVSATDRQNILSAFEKLKARQIMKVSEELKDEIRLDFEHIVLQSFGMEDYFDKIKSSLLSMQETKMCIRDRGYITKNVSVLNKFTDIRNNAMWYYADVMEAANTHLANSSNDTETWVK